MQLQTTWEKDRAIYTFKNGSGMKVIGAAESVNKCKGKIKNCGDTWNLEKVTLPCFASHLLNQI